MGTKFKIEEAPNFVVKVDLDRAGGTVIQVPFTFKYFTQDELSELQVEWQKRRDSAVDEAKGRDLSNPEWDELRRELERVELADIIEAWDFDDAYDEDSLRRLLNSMRSHYLSIVTAFNKGLNPARLGN